MNVSLSEIYFCDIVYAVLIMAENLVGIVRDGMVGGYNRDSIHAAFGGYFC